MISRLLSLLRRQDGVAMPVAIGALTVTAGLAAGTFAVSLEGQHASARDRDSKRALAAAEAGLQMAFLKLSEVRPTDSQCVTTAAVLPGTAHSGAPASLAQAGTAAAGECPSHTAQLGNGARYRYVIATPTSGTCAAVTTSESPEKDRCITSIGIVNGVQRRLQSKMLYTPPLKPFFDAGLVARDDVIIRNNETNVASTVGANGSVTVTNGTKVNGKITLGPDADWSFTTGGGTLDNKQPTYRDDPFEFAEQELIDGLYAASKATNDNGSLSSSFYSSGTRAFAMGNDTSYTLNGGTYNFCSFTMNQGAKLRVTAGQVAKIYIDSPRRTGSGCAAPEPNGQYVQAQSSEVNREYGADPAQLELYVYGRADDGMGNPGIDLGNAAWLYAGVYAPDASMNLLNGANLIGAATVKNAQVVNNSDFIWHNGVLNKTIPGTGLTDSLGWFECAKAPTVATDPESGCA
jgi:Tfp pilus assembly protein PilX